MSELKEVGQVETLVDQLVHHMLTSESEQTVRDMAGHVGDQVHGVLKRNGMLMKSVGGAVGMGVLAAVQVLADTVEFARRSMDDENEAKHMDAAIAKLFIGEIAPILPAFARLTSTQSTMDQGE